jgi:hypothetical protein
LEAHTTAFLAYRRGTADRDGMSLRWGSLLVSVLATIGVGGLGCVAADAATVRFSTFDQCGYPGDDCDTATPAVGVIFRAAPGEVNTVTVSRAGTDVIVRDATATVTVGAGDQDIGSCVSVDEHAVSCPAGARELPDGELTFTIFQAFLGDLDDSIAFTTGIFFGTRHISHYAQLFGGPGDDQIAGTQAADFITPGLGRDRVSAFGENDVIHAVDHERDRIDCGAGRNNRVQADRIDVLRHCQHVTRTN